MNGILSQENCRLLVHIHGSTRTKINFCWRNSKKIGRGGTQKPGWSIRYQKIGYGVLVDII